MIKFNIERYRQLEARAELLNAATRLAEERCREAKLEFLRREERLQKATPTHLESRYSRSDEAIREASALESDVQIGRECFEQCQQERVASYDRWAVAGRLFRACQDFLRTHGIDNPDAPHDQHSVYFRPRAVR